MICNLGHTIGHALEKVSHYKVMHGYAVAFGILVEAKIAELLGFLNADDFYMIQTVFAKLGILGHHYKKYSVEKILSATKSDKKNRGGKTRYVLLERIGKINAFDNAFAQVVLDAVVRKAIKWVVASNCKVASG
ncbi:hypothetical protein AYO45_06440 [Gammaproteobacteria bacterium SCGC AG-212-F23]|nr:hypothetical protein AYO45_06440 [Gammaproteobacteria bacterium SCGC AG-212-F23]